MLPGLYQVKYSFLAEQILVLIAVSLPLPTTTSEAAFFQSGFVKRRKGRSSTDAAKSHGKSLSLRTESTLLVLCSITEENPCNLLKI